MVVPRARTASSGKRSGTDSTLSPAARPAESRGKRVTAAAVAPPRLCDHRPPARLTLASHDRGQAIGRLDVDRPAGAWKEPRLRLRDVPRDLPPRARMVLRPLVVVHPEDAAARVIAVARRANPREKRAARTVLPGPAPAHLRRARRRIR